MSNKKWKMSQIFMAFSEYLNFTNSKLCTCIPMSKISIRVFSRSDELYLPSAQYRNCGAVEVQYPWWCLLSYIKREATTFYGIPRCTLSFMQLRKLVTHVLLKWKRISGFILGEIEFFNSWKRYMITEHWLLVLSKNTGSLKIANKILQVFYTGATTVLAYSDFKEQQILLK